MTEADKRRDLLETNITLGMVAVRAARIARQHSPNPTTVARETDAQADLDDMLDIYRKLYGADVLAY